MHFIYRFLTHVAKPFLPGYLERRTRRGKEDRARLTERYGHATITRPEGEIIWIHAASVGESKSTLYLVRELLRSYPSLSILVTTGTKSSAQLMADQLPDRAFHQYVPLDVTQWVKTFLDIWKPCLVLWVESEFWPNNLFEIKKQNIPLILLNGSVSENTFKNWSRFSGLIRPILNCFTFCFGKSQQDLKRLRSLGVQEEKSTFEGNLKYAASPLIFDQNTLDQLKQLIGKRPIWLAASTHEGEESLVAQVQKNLKKAFPDILTLLAIRHPHRAEDVNLLLQGEGLSIAQRSLGEEISEKTDVYLIDTLGEMGLFYALSPIVCMGGTFGNVGGHNIIEPAQLDTAICFGPNMSNFQEVADQFVALKAAVRVEDAASLAACIEGWVKKPSAARTICRQAKELSLTQGDVLQKIIEKLKPYLTQSEKE
ncbi:uncharacterized protein LOC111320362 [Stylophora pistillata]|uniref:uncharacterized protein LOC111320362 n=1 Tax=Stylophora pistillata TaxID=50429 RepID=UPI000C039875|nr:uncharacterized protein LOC111320362 [Stylophora pistillata]